MADEFLETDLDTPTETDLDQAYGSRFLGVEDIGSRKVRTRVQKVRKEEIKERDTGRPKMGSLCTSSRLTSRWCSTQPIKTFWSMPSVSHRPPGSVRKQG